MPALAPWYRSAVPLEESMQPTLRSLFGHGVVLAEGPVVDAGEELFPEERAYVHSAVLSRRREFATARVLARRALAELGVAAVPLVPRADRSPVWPPGYVGSISHTRDACAVAVAQLGEVQSLGLDIEAPRELEAGLEEAILRPREIAVLGELPPAERSRWLMLFFSAKEAYYKCQYPLSGVLLDHHDVEVEIDVAAGRFAARADPPHVPASVRHLAGKFAWSQGMVMCGVELRRDAVSPRSW